MKLADLQNKSKKELATLLSEARGKLGALSFRTPGRELKQVHERRDLKKTIARLLTIMPRQK